MLFVREVLQSPPSVRSAVEPVIGYLKAAYRMDRNYTGSVRRRPALTAADCNFRRLIRWLRFLLRSWWASQWIRLLPREQSLPQVV